MNATEVIDVDVDFTEEQDSATFIVWVLLIFCAVVSFWFQAVLTEERFVPALNVVSVKFNIPDDVAGATLMAAGASSPELFSSIVALFITHSALGLGTIVGSEIFNQLMICCGSIFASRNYQLTLDKAVIAREVGFYALAIILLYQALDDSRPSPDDDETGTNHIFISLFDASLLFLAYVLYVIVCSNFDAICGLFGGGSSAETQSLRAIDTELDMPDIPYMHQLKHEPKSNWKKGDKTGDDSASDGPSVGVYGTMKQIGMSVRNSVRGFANDNSTRGSLMGFTYRAFAMHSAKPSELHDIYALEANEYTESLSCFMWQRSRFYTKAKVSMNGWQLRWFTLTHSQVISVPDRGNYDDHKFKYPDFDEIAVDKGHLLIQLSSSTNKSKLPYVFMAPSAKVLKAVVSKYEEIIEFQQTKRKSDGGDPEFLDVAASAHDEEEEEEPSLIEYPSGASYFAILVHFILFPFKLAMHLTVPDTRHPSTPLSKGLLACLSCLLWLVVGSYAMVASLETISELLSIPPAVVGVTVSAVGTSLPNYVGSQCAAKAGLGNMAVSNAFGSNTFNILVGLGLPWVLYILFGNDGNPYHGLKDEGITESVLILSVVLAAFVVMIIMSHFVLYEWHAYTFALMYVAYIIYATAPYIFT
mmetsp:Transcript_2394/g.3158  ORF Transcript_2394/g.3158 Transcript_2394/m.3158 type:complete len:644 (-) Transcript_2394:234-2165(-)